jgi:hypothetical protein
MLDASVRLQGSGTDTEFEIGPCSEVLVDRLSVESAETGCGISCRTQPPWRKYF